MRLETGYSSKTLRAFADILNEVYMADSSWENPTIMGFVSRAIGIPDTLRIIGFPQERTDDRATFDAANAR